VVQYVTAHVAATAVLQQWQTLPHTQSIAYTRHVQTS
jgi:hypothetical protein